ncbi:hypothetical protein VTG60DRAFT_2366 [Thermothelomyces hinnuleus]
MKVCSGLSFSSPFAQRSASFSYESEVHEQGIPGAEPAEQDSISWRVHSGTAFLATHKPYRTWRICRYVRDEF